jgi:neutral amino acid transport system permease protein
MDLVGTFQSALRAGFGPTAASYALLAIGLNLQFGYAGLANFGQVGFMLLGAYGVGITVATWGWSMWLGIVVGLLACVVFALLLGLPTLKLRADYFAITTIAAAEILRFVFRSSTARDLTGGPFGLQSIAGDFHDLNPFDQGRYGIGQFSYTHTQLWTMLCAWSVVVLAVLFVAALMSSPWGRVIRSIREDEDVAASVGKNVFAYKLQALVIGGVIGGLAGVLLALGNATVNANTFQPLVTFFAYAALIMGGVGTRLGPVFGAILFWFIFTGSQSLLSGMSSEGWLPTFLRGGDAQGALAAVLIGALVIGVTAFRPQGVFGKREDMVFGD